MSYSTVALEDKLLEMYPEIREQGISVSLNFDGDENAYVIQFKKDSHQLTTNLDKQDADECMDGVKCVHLGVQVSQFISNFKGAA